MSGPLAGIRIIEFAGLGPAPFAGMMLADHGAEVIRIDRPGVQLASTDPLLRSRRSVVLDLKKPADVARCRDLCGVADAVIEGFRPGTMERLGLGPEVLLADNPALVYGRMTGWGQEGPLADTAGHDIDYIAVSGTLALCGAAGCKPAAPLNLVGDFGGGGMMLAFGVASALLAVRAGRGGQVVDCAMTDGSALLAAMMWGFRADGTWQEERGVNLLDGGAPFYDTYETADGGFIAIGAIEPQFYERFRQLAGIANDPLFDDQDDRSMWPLQKAALSRLFASRDRAEWEMIFRGSDACVAPVLTMSEATRHPHNVERQTFVSIEGHFQPAPAPRYSKTPCAPPRAVPFAGADNHLVAVGLGES